MRAPSNPNAPSGASETTAAEANDPFDFDDDEVQAATVPLEHAGWRVDQSLARLFPDYSRSRLQAWLALGRIVVDGARADAARKVRGGEMLMLAAAQDPREIAFVAEAMPLAIVHEDASLLVIDKPAGLVVH